MNRTFHRLARIAAFSIGAGIVFLGAGSIFHQSALVSAAMGATAAALGLFGVISFIYAAKGEVPETDFNAAIYAAIQKVSAKEDEE